MVYSLLYSGDYRLIRHHFAKRLGDDISNLIIDYARLNDKEKILQYLTYPNPEWQPYRDWPLLVKKDGI